MSSDRQDELVDRFFRNVAAEKDQIQEEPAQLLVLTSHSVVARHGLREQGPRDQKLLNAPMSYAHQ
jgi:hypothetical protein